ncbi:site-specific DNA-methyltransferase [Defluviitalea raffinosedens]|uniref:site-specific DNA-methyltransferase n=1 Tax=Defluviitalea raffinosedens TaxID=1450156 RepID=UPI00195EECCC|nr:site-specific DNA-methyltransferase [Defluviitalea raffinosedens]MBM7686682.1 adenine-specific DNA-methyltransferase [Defluviitalea raffinosedens]
MIETTLTGKTPDIGEENIKKLMTMFPEVVTEGKVDFEKLKQVLGEYVDDSNERYNFTWNGKGRALRLSQTPSLGTLRPCKEESKNWDTTQNLYIEGDNLEVLKLLQKSYYGKIKMIYIDPPYNTGKDFVYRDDFHDSLENYKRITGQVDGNGKAISTNTETSGRYHTDWLNMMYPRLRLARNLLKDDGVIFISIDDNEVHNLIKICDEVFGEANRIALICHKARASVSNDKIISNNHNIILFYAKNVNVIESIRKDIGLDPELNGFDLDDNDGRGAYRLVPVDGPGGAKKGNPYYEFMGVEGYFRFSKETMQEKYNMGQIVKKGNSLYQKYYLATARQTRKTDTTWWEDGGFTSSATSKLKELMGGSYFDNPKPIELIMRMLKLMTNSDKDALILDFFSGSATTAHAVMQLNAEDGGNRKFIMVQLPEPTEENSEAYKAGYKNICEIGIERIRRAGEKIKEEYKDKENIENLDIGFKVFKLDTSNIRKWQPDYDNLEQSLMDYVDNFVEGRTEFDVVYEIMLKYGLDLTYPVDEFTIAQKKVYSIGFGMLMICLDDEITTEVAKGILAKIKELSPESSRVVFKDNGFKSDSNKTNIKEILKSGGIEEFITI